MLVGSEASDCQDIKLKAIAKDTLLLKECDRKICSDALKTDGANYCLQFHSTLLNAFSFIILGSRIREVINEVISKWNLMKERRKSFLMLDNIDEASS
jgi:hypothetical protein